ncbi:hypothetical protein GE061_001229 [Apolygus lucorum]|uniref:Phosphatidylinositol-4-phosphate 3-kinase n=1 Tax=Apolygus lucorum TaxID=248454 RepID=A0A8S9Y833_APOLU|nr:hypothetical protein GE061_001229 [Apolygus lucorum]
MSGFSQRDHERKFKEDLETAQALSLESLALEKFRLEREKSLQNFENTSSCNIESRTNKDDRRFQIITQTQRSSRSFNTQICQKETISRPRPGSFNTKESNISIIKPPPQPGRRCSVTHSTPSTPSNDLISFNSPSGSKHNKTPEIAFELSEPDSIGRTTSSPFQSSPHGLYSHVIGQTACNNNLLGQSPNSQFYNNSFIINHLPRHPKADQKVPAVLPVMSRQHSKVSGDPAWGILEALSKLPNSNLIDFTPSARELTTPSNNKSVRVSLLETFDPLLSGSSSDGLESDVLEEDLEGSIYEPYDPFDFLYSTPSSESCCSEPIYSTINKGPSSPSHGPPLPPRNATPVYAVSSKVQIKSQSRLYQNVVRNQRSALHDPDLMAFHKMVVECRSSYLYDNELTNSGIITSPTLENGYTTGVSAKLVIHCSNMEKTVNFTCDLSSSVEHVLCHVAFEIGCVSITDYKLKVHGLEEFLEPHRSLSEYEYVHECLKLDKDIEFSLLNNNEVKKMFQRTPEDDRRDCFISLDDLLPKEPMQPISHESLLILLETLEKEIERVISTCKEVHVNGSYDSISNLQTGSVKQAVKVVCSVLGNIEPLQITNALDDFIQACKEIPLNKMNIRTKPEIVDDDGDYSEVMLGEYPSSNNIYDCCDRIRDSVQLLIQMYCHMYRVDFQLSAPMRCAGVVKNSSELHDRDIYIGCLHRIPSDWGVYDSFRVDAQIYHGTRPLGTKTSAPNISGSDGFKPRLVFAAKHPYVVSSLPRESRIVIVVYGITYSDGQNQPTPQQVELGWASIQLFDYNGYINQGNFLLSIWPADNSKKIGPAPNPGTHPLGDSDPILDIQLPDCGYEVSFPEIDTLEKPKSYDFDSLDCATQQQLLDTINQDCFANPKVTEREVLWEKRHYLLNHPQALPKVLLAAQNWDFSCLPDLHSMVHYWAEMDPVSALQLLLPCFPDNVVRNKAVEWINRLTNDQFVDYSPQIVQALKYENYEASPLAKLLLDRSLSSPRVAHHLYWLLVHELPGDTPQNTCDAAVPEKSRVCEARYFRRLQLVLRALLAVSGDALRKAFMSQQLLVKGLAGVADNVKTSKDDHKSRMTTLTQGLHTIHSSLIASPTCLPLSPSLFVTGIQVRSSSYFPSNTLPLKINFTNEEETIIPAIFKVGDDLQQDMLTLQMIHLMDKLWLKEGLDLKMVTFACVPTGFKKGMIELVSEAETLRKIQNEFGLTGSFKDRPIAEWLAKHNPSALDYERAVHNFTASCAGYCVATYVLGICDRHNDNIMLKTSGHLFHIDFGKFLGDAQMFGNFKRDRTPFVLTSDMAYVINGGDKPSARFHHFVDLCCQAFNIVRKEGNIILNLFMLMASSGAGGLTVDSVRYVQSALLPTLTNAEAAATFARKIQSSLKSWFTQFNFFLHNLAQLRFSGDHNVGELLSFVPKVYSVQQEGRLKSVEVFNYQKRYDPEKYYIYILRVERANQPDPSYLFRSYKEFCEFQHKICIMFPLAKCYSLQGTSLHVGRSNIKQVAAKRMVEIKKFLSSLFLMADEICHSDLVYTFFHPLLRDQQEASIHQAKLKDRKKDRLVNNDPYIIKGQISLYIHYEKDTLWVMVQHVQGLNYLPNGQEPSTYVKVYLLPDPTKDTKRKTKVIKKSCHPSFMEMLEYRVPGGLERIQQRYLQATVWNYDTLQENEFLGGTVIKLSDFDLARETTDWYSLGNVHR